MTAAAIATYFMPPSAQPLEFGANIDGSGNYFNAGVMLNDWGKVISVSNDGNENDSIVVPQANISDVNGYQMVETNIGVTLPSQTNHSTLKVISSDPVTGKHVISVTGDMSKADTIIGTTRSFRWTGTKPTFFSVTRFPNASKIAQEWLSGVEGKWLRNLDGCYQNRLPIVGATVKPQPTDRRYPVPPGATGSIIPYQDMVDAIAAKMAIDPGFVGFWDVLDNDTPDEGVDGVRQRAIYQRDNLPVRTKIALEYGNEQPWNEAFSGVIRLWADAFQNGYGGNVTAAAPNPVFAFKGEYGADGPGNTRSPAAAAGERVFFHLYGVGWSAWRALKTVPAGSEINENEYWTREPWDVLVSARRWRAFRLNQIIEIYRSVFGEARFQSQIVPVMMGQAHAGSITDQLQIERTYVPGFWEKVKGVGYAWYFDDDANQNPTTASEMEASFRSKMERTKTNIRDMVARVLAMGKIPMCYEGGGPHPSKDPWSGTYQAAWNAFLYTPAGQAYFQEIGAFMKANVPGVIMQYTLAYRRPWALKDNWTDLINEKRAGLLAGLAQ